MLMGSVGLKQSNSLQYSYTYRDIRSVWGRILRNTMELTLRITALAVGRQVLEEVTQTQASFVLSIPEDIVTA